MSGDPFIPLQRMSQSTRRLPISMCRTATANARVHKYDPDGKLLFSWGESGTGEGQFNIAHNVLHRQGRLGLRG